MKEFFVEIAKIIWKVIYTIGIETKILIKSYFSI